MQTAHVGAPWVPHPLVYTGHRTRACFSGPVGDGTSPAFLDRMSADVTNLMHTLLLFCADLVFGVLLDVQLLSAVFWDWTSTNVMNLTLSLVACLMYSFYQQCSWTRQVQT
jgi:hypothetical protein